MMTNFKRRFFKIGSNLEPGMRICLKTLVVAVSLVLGTIHHSFALDAPVKISQSRAFGICSIILINASTRAYVVVGTSFSNYYSGGSRWVPNRLSSNNVSATILSQCVSGSSADEFNISYNNGAEAGSSLAADDGMGLTFTFRGSTYDYRLIGTTGTTYTASNHVTEDAFPPRDTTAPTLLSITRVNPLAETTDADTLVFGASFSEPVELVTGADFTVSGTTATITSVTGSGENYNVTVSGGNLASLDGAVGLALSGSQHIQDLSGNALTNTLPSSVNQSYNVNNDVTAPQLEGLYSKPGNGGVRAGKKLNFTLEFSETVYVDTSGGTPQLGVNIGFDTRQATLVSGSGSDLLVFRYTVQTGDDSNGAAISLGALSANGGTIQDAAGNAANLTPTTPFPSLNTSVDAVAPTIASVSAPAGAAYKAGDSLSFTVNFDETVRVTGTPQLALTIGSTMRQAAYVSGSNSAALTFNYTIQSDDFDNDGITVSAIDLNGGTIRDVFANNATLTFTPPSTSSVLVDGLAPALTGFSRKTPSTETTDADSLVFTAVFVENVKNVDSSDFSATGTTASVTDVTGSGNVFDITVSGGDLADLDGVVGLSFASGQNITDLAGNVLTNTSPLVRDETYKVFNRQPQTIKFNLSGLTSHYGNGIGLGGTASSNLPVTYTTSSAASICTVSGNSVFTHGTGSCVIHANQAGDSNYQPAPQVTGTITITPRPITLTAGGQSKIYGDILTLDNTAFALTSGSLPIGETIDTVTLVSDGGVDASTDADVATYVKNIKISGVATSGGGFDASNYDITFVNGDLVINKRPVTITASNQSKVYGEALTLDNTAFTVSSALPNGEVITNATLNSATGIDKSTTADVATYSDEISISGPLTGMAGTGDGFDANNYDITFVSGDLAVTQRPIKLVANTQQKEFGTSSRLSPNAFTLLDKDGDNTLPNGERIVAVVATSTGGFDSDENAAVGTKADDLVLGVIAARSTNFIESNYDITRVAGDFVIVDTIGPTVTSVAVPGDGSYKVPSGLGFVIFFNENVTVTGSPQLTLTIGSTTRQATYQSASSGPKVLAFSYPIQSGDLDTDGITINALSLSGGSIKDGNGNDAVLTLNGVRDTSGVLVDAVVPNITLGALVAVGDGTYTSTVTLSEIDSGDLLQQSDFAVGNGSATISGTGVSRTATVTPTSDFTGTVTLDVAAGAFTDAAGNANTAAKQVSIFHDGIVPTITLGALTAVGDGTYTSAITLSEADSGNLFQQSDLDVGNGSATLSGTGLNRTATITPTAAFAGTVTLDVAAGAFTDAAGNPNTAAKQVSIAHDGVAPTIALGDLVAVGNGTYTSTVTLSEADSGNLLEESDLSVGNGTATLSGTGLNRTATVTPKHGFDGTITLNVAAGAFTDAAGNPNVAAKPASIFHDATAPTITLGALTASKGGTYTSTITLSEADSGNLLQQSDLSVGNGSAILSGTGKSRIAIITPTASFHGTITLDVAAGAFTDAAGNDNVAAKQVSTAHDGVAPTITLGDLTKQSGNSYTSDITLSEAAAAGSSFDVGDLKLTNATATLSGSGTNYTASLTPLNFGEQFSVSVPANAFTDAASNGNVASLSVSALAHSVEETEQLISNMLQNNARIILQNPPKLNRRLDRLNGRLSPIGSLRAFGLSVTNSGLPFDAVLGREGGSFSFSLNRARQQQGKANVQVNPYGLASSFGVPVSPAAPVDDARLANGQNPEAVQQRIDRAHAAPFELDAKTSNTENTAGLTSKDQTYGLVKPSRFPNSDVEVDQAALLPRYDIWMEGTIGRQNVTDGRTNFTLIHAGADYLITPNVLVGLGAQFDWTDYAANSAAPNADAKTNGFGFLVGPYLTARLRDNLYVDSRVMWGQSYNEVSPLGTFTDKVTTDRILASAAFIGEMSWNDITIRPQVRANYFRDASRAYVDSFGLDVSSSVYETGVLEFGPSLQKRVEIGNGFTITPKFAFDGVWTFAERNTTSSTVETSGTGIRGRIQSGFDLATENGWTFTLTGQYDGIGQSDYEAYSGSVRVSKRW